MTDDPCRTRLDWMIDPTATCMRVESLNKWQRPGSARVPAL